VLDAFSSGIGLMGYTGHGSVTLWAQEGILTVEDVPGLRNADRLPIVFTATCLSGFFVHPSTVSLGEALVRSPQGGAVAALVPSARRYWKTSVTSRGHWPTRWHCRPPARVMIYGWAMRCWRRSRLSPLNQRASRSPDDVQPAGRSAMPLQR